MLTDLFWILLSIQIFLGAFDTLFHHELTERLAWRISQRRELKLHSVRNFVYAIAFLLIGWTIPGGLIATILITLLVAEIIITLWDFVEEDRSRSLPATERVTHTLLALNYGAILTILVPVLWGWQSLPTGLIATHYGLWSGIASLAALAVSIFGLRDCFAARRLQRIDSRPAYQLATALPGRKTILVTGATGFVGNRLVAALKEAGHDVIAHTRNPANAGRLGAPIRLITDFDQIGDLDRIDAIVNLAGEPVATGLWTRAKRARIIRSRLEMTRGLTRLVARLVEKPSVYIGASAIGWYGLRGDEIITEVDAGPAESCFSHQSCHQVERAARNLEVLGLRVIRLRIGLVLDPEGGLLARLLPPFDLGLGGPIGSGRQWMSWISRDDLVRMIIFAIARPSVHGVINATAPKPVTNRDFSRAMGRALRRPVFLPLPALPLRLVGGDFAKELLLGGQRVITIRAREAGFRFLDEDIDPTLARLLGRAARADSDIAQRSASSPSLHAVLEI